jgi:hypothetical protein
MFFNNPDEAAEHQKREHSDEVRLLIRSKVHKNVISLGFLSNNYVSMSSDDSILGAVGVWDGEL